MALYRGDVMLAFHLFFVPSLHGLDHLAIDASASTLVSRTPGMANVLFTHKRRFGNVEFFLPPVCTPVPWVSDTDIFCRDVVLGQI